MLHCAGFIEPVKTPEDCRCRSDCEQGEMDAPAWPPGEPVRVEVGAEKGGLKEDKAGDPDGGGASENGQQQLGRHGLDEEEQKRCEKDSATEEQPRTGHRYLG